MRVWDCKIGWAGELPQGADLPMREAVGRAFIQLTGAEPEFIFSGWGGALTEVELAVVEDRLPDPAKVIEECDATILDASGLRAYACRLEEWRNGGR